MFTSIWGNDPIRLIYLIYFNGIKPPPIDMFGKDLWIFFGNSADTSAFLLVHFAHCVGLSTMCPSEVCLSFDHVFEHHSHSGRVCR